jgi:hypothetical protein
VTLPSKYQDLLDDDDVRRWHDNLAARSVVTAGVYLRGMGLYCELNHTTPRRILQQAKTKGFRDSFTDFVREMEKKGRAGSYIARFKKVLISWTSYNNVGLKLRVNIAGEFNTPTLEDEIVPTAQQLARILRNASSRGKVSAALMAFCGLRPETLGDYEGKDGLMIRDFPEAKINSGSIRFETTPAMLIVRKPISKARHQYFAFVTGEALTYVTEYLEERIRNGERLDGRSPLLGFDSRGLRGKEKVKNEFLRTTLVSRDVKEAILKSGFDWRPYVLRAYTATAFDVAEARGLISHPWRQFFMGHKGDIEARYSTNKNRLPPPMVEEMRNAYKRCEPLLSTTSQPLDQMAVVKEAKIETLKSIAKNMFGLDLLDVKIAKEKELAKELSQDESIELFENEMKMLREKPDPQDIVEEAELKRYLDDGWQFVSTLPSGKVLIRK